MTNSRAPDRTFSKDRIACLLVLLVLCGLYGCGDGNVAQVPPAETRALQHTAFLSESIGKRPAGSENEAMGRDYIAAEFHRLGYDVTIQPFSFVQNGVTIASANVIAQLKGQSNREVIVGGHYDSVPEAAGTGAADNAAAIGIILALARDLGASPPPHTVKFVAFGAEETGHQGSEYYVSQMTAIEISQTLGMINLDTPIGGDKIYVYGTEGQGGWIRDRALDIAVSQGIPLETNPGLNPAYPAGTTGDWSDHASFKGSGIPYAYFEATNWEIGDLDGYLQTVKHGAIWHTDKDTLAFLEAEFPGRIAFQLKSFITVLRELLFRLDPPAAFKRTEKQGTIIRKMTRDGKLIF